MNGEILVRMTPDHVVELRLLRDQLERAEREGVYVALHRGPNTGPNGSEHLRTSDAGRAASKAKETIDYILNQV